MFDAIAAQAQKVLDLGDRGEAGQRLRALTWRWSKAMHKLGGVVALGGDSESPQVPVLTRGQALDGPQVSRMLAPLRAADRPERRAVQVELDDYLAPVNGLLSWPVLPPFRPLADGLGSDLDRARFWELVRGAGGVLVRTGPDPDRRLLYLRAVRSGDRRVFAFSDPERSSYQVKRLSQITGWARSEAAQVHQAYLPTDLTGKSTPPELWLSAQGAAQAVAAYLAGDPQAELAAGGLRAVLLSLLGGPPVAGNRFLPTVLRRLRAANDQELRELFGDNTELLELLGVLSARIPQGDSLRGDLDDFIGGLFPGS